MKYDILFYLSKKTGYCEKRVKKAFEKIDFDIRTVNSSVTPVNLGEQVCDSLKYCNVVVIIGGLYLNDDDNLSVVLSRVMSSSGLTLSNMRKLNCDNQNGYIIRYKNQVILALPDNPKAVESMLSDELLNYIKNIYSDKQDLKYSENN